MGHCLWTFVFVSGGLIIPSCCNELFLDADITFLFTPDCNAADDIPCFYQAITDRYRYTPLRHILLCQTTSGFRYPNGSLASLMAFDKEKSARVKAIFLSLDATLGYYPNTIYLKCEILMKIASLELRQDYIFAHMSRSRDSACLRRHIHVLGTVKLVVFENSGTHFLVPCLSCNPVILSRLETISWEGIRQTWDFQNSDMHKYTLYLPGLAPATCGLLHGGFENLTDYDICTVATIALKYNLTLIEYKGQIQAYFGDTSFGVFSNMDGINFESEYYIYQVVFATLHFITVSPPPSSQANGIKTFVSPFDVVTWICLLLVILVVAGFLTWDANATSWRDLAGIMLDKVLVVTFIFLGQVGESTGKIYRAGTTSFILVTLWLLGTFVIMTNLYQGTVYSNLAVLIPAKRPSGVHDLINWDIPIVDLEYLYNYKSQSFHPVLTDIVIPSLISSGGNESGLTKFVTRLKAKFVSTKVPDIIKPRQNGISNTVVVFAFIHSLVYVERQIKNMGDYHIVRNRGYSPFVMVQYSVGSKKMLTLYFAKEWGRISQSGLSELWYTVFKRNIMLRNKAKLKVQNKYFEAVQHAFGDIRVPVTFHEAQPISVNLVLPAFVLCTIIMAAASVAFMAESGNIKFFGLWIIQGWKSIGRICKVRKLVETIIQIFKYKKLSHTGIPMLFGRLICQSCKTSIKNYTYIRIRKHLTTHIM